MVRRADGLIKARKRMATTFDGHFFLAFLAGLSSERLFNTVLPVVSDLIRTIGSSGEPTLVTVPPLGPLIETRFDLATL